MIDENKLIIEIEKRNSVFTEEQMDLLEYLIIKQAVLGNDTNVGSKWIPCSVRLPSENGKYLAAGIKGSVYIAEFYKGVINKKPVSLWCRSGWNYCKVIAWMELPPAYERRNEDD